MEILGFIIETLIHGICCGFVCAAIHEWLEHRRKK